MSEVMERVDRLEEWRARAELRAGRLLEQVAAAARSIEKAANAIEHQGAALQAHLAADSEERAVAAERRRLRNRLAAAATGALTVLGTLAGVLTR